MTIESIDRRTTRSHPPAPRPPTQPKAEVKQIKDIQPTLFDTSIYESRSGHRWGWESGEGLELNLLIPPSNKSQPLKQYGSKFLVPNSDAQKLGTKNEDPEIADAGELGTNNSLVPNSELWQPPIGCFEQKWIKDRPYWYWRYYNDRGKKASLYLAKDYNRAIRRAMLIGVPTDAKNPHPSRSPTDPQTQIRASRSCHDIAPTADGTSRSTPANPRQIVPQSGENAGQIVSGSGDRLSRSHPNSTG